MTIWYIGLLEGLLSADTTVAIYWVLTASILYLPEKLCWMLPVLADLAFLSIFYKCDSRFADP